MFPLVQMQIKSQQFQNCPAARTPSSSFHSLDVDIPGVDFPGVGGIAEEDVECPLPVRGEQLLGLLLHLVTASRPDLGSRAAVATRAVQPTNLRKWVKSLLREMT